MNKNIGVAVLLVIAFVVGLYFVVKKTSPSQTEPAGDVLTSEYSNSAVGFSIRTPKEYAVDESYKYQMDPTNIISGVKFTIPSAKADGTNLAHDTYISVESLPGVTECLANLFLYGTNPVRSVTENGVTYSVASAEGAGAGNRYAEMVFALPDSNPCLAIRYFVHYGVIENYPEGTVTAFDMDALISDFDSIRKSLKVNQ